MSNGINFNSGYVMEYCKKMNNSRRIIMNYLNSIKANYNSVEFTYWNGSSRKFFHENVFGKDGESGLIGAMNDKKTAPYGLCYALNELLYYLAKYVCDVKNSDAEYIKNYSPLNTSMFVSNDVAVNVVKVIDYNSISEENVVISPEVIYTLRSKWNDIITKIKNEIAIFQNNLNLCINQGIMDDSVTALRQVTKQLDVKIVEFGAKLDVLFGYNEDVLTKASASSKEASNSNSQVSSLLQNISFD